ncbi:MAG TPA: serine/threonine-protein kinase [Kofleriaceae bacterium]|nr:serine/threonine-protein kinase [Kofleriaceae bacterium]
MAETRFGPFVVHELLGTGGMATVHLAETQSAGGFRKRVALKRMLRHLAEEPEIVEAFAREARLASHLHHQHIAQTFDLGVIEGTYYIAMELVSGPTLRQITRQCESAAGAIPIEHAVDIALQVAGALDYAHNLADEHGKPLGLVHRDVSPANIIVSGAGVVKLIDFGLAKVSSSRSTKVGILKGKLSYMAPEYTLGQLDHRADLFALGVVLHEMLTGRALFDAPTDADVIDQLRAMPIQPPSRWNPRVPPDLDNIAMTALQRDPAQRWQSAAAMSAALQAAAKTDNLVTSPATLATWVEWAFTQEPREDVGGLTAIIQDLGDASDPRRKKVTTPTSLPTTPASPRSIPKRIDTNVATNPVPVVRRLRVVRALVLIVALAAGAASAAYFAAGLL